MIIREDYLKQIRPFYNKNIIKIITGIRRSGKSTLLKQIIKELLSNGVSEGNIIHINLDEFKNMELLNPFKLEEYINSKLSNDDKYYLFLDEIQEVENFEKLINQFNNNPNNQFDIYITGSNSKMLSSELATFLTGRYVSFHILPFSFKEYNEYMENSDIDKTFIDYVNFGGFPQTTMFNDKSSKMTLLKDLYDSIVIKDISDRNNIRNISFLNNYLLYLINTIGSIFSATSINKYFKSQGRSISRETLYNYKKYAQDVFFLYNVSRYDIKGKRILETSDKIFINDQGFRSLFYNNEKDIEKVLENIIYFELLRRGYDVFIGAIDTKEVDFIALKGDKKVYIQVSYILSSEKTIEREFGAYRSIEDQFPKYVISMDKLDMSRDGIVHINIIDFLLSENKELFI